MLAVGRGKGQDTVTRRDAEPNEGWEKLASVNRGGGKTGLETAQKKKTHSAFPIDFQ